ncbi:MAG: BamA/TamA family outer membrane protein [Firmicutes bacterium]|nr:BamA/TamA family outer membrane protein [Bacillota bacterium]
MKKGSAKIWMLLVLVLLFFQAAGGVFAREAPLVKSISVQGNLLIDTEIIKAAILKTKINEAAVEQQIIDDLHSIYDLGYFQDASVDFEPANGGVTVVFEVIENPVVQEIVFHGPAGIPFAQYAKTMKTQPGYVLNVRELWDDLFDLREWVAAEHGYLIRVADLEGDSEGRIEVELVETLLKDVVLEGHEKTKDFVILRELSFEPGDPVNIKEIDQSLRKVLMLGFFDEISRDFSEEEDPDETVLTVNLKERKTGSATFGVSYSSNDGLVGFIEAADENFLGRAQRVNATLQLGKGLHSYELGFYEPYIEKGGTSLGVNLYRRGRDFKKDAQESSGKLEGSLITNGGDLTLGRPFTDFTRGRLTFKMEDNKYTQRRGDFLDSAWPQDYKNRTVGFGVDTNTVDHPLYPTMGFKNDAYIELGFLKETKTDADSRYAKLRLEHSRFFEIKEGGYVLAFRGLGGRLLSGELMDNEKFAIGGADTLRGYSLGGNDSLKGDQMVVFNAEFRFPVIDKVTGVVFTDWGKAWDKDAGLSLGDLNSGFGLGVRLDTPLGLLRLDYGLGKTEEEKLQGQFYFGLGQTF